MSTRYTLYIPKEAFIVEVSAEIAKLTRLFRGATRTEGTGVWYNEAGDAVCEDVYVFTFLTAGEWHNVQYQVRSIEREISRLSGEDIILSHHEQTNLSFTLPLT